MSRIPRTNEDIEKELFNQLELLNNSCSLYDAGFYQEAKQISTRLRVLLHDTKKMKSLMTQLDLKRNKFLDTSKPVMDVFFNGYCGLVNLQLDQIDKAWKYIPIVIQNHDEKWIEFSTWWLNPIIVDTKRRIFSRSDLIRNVADTDGGAHVDTGFEEQYMDLARNNSLGWSTCDDKNNEVSIYGDPVFACLRSIGYETIKTFKKILGDKLKLQEIDIKQLDNLPITPEKISRINTRIFPFIPEEGGNAFIVRGGQEKAIEAWDYYINNSDNPTSKLHGMFNKASILLTMRRDSEAFNLFNNICKMINDVDTLKKFRNTLTDWLSEQSQFKNINIAIDILNQKIQNLEK